MDNRPLVVAAVSWILGAAIPSLWEGHLAIIAMSALIFAVLSLAVLRRMGIWLAVICIASLLLACGERTWMEQRNHSPLTLTHASSEAVVSGIVVSLVDVDGDLVSFKLRTLTVKLSPTAPELKMKMTVLVRMKLDEQLEQQIAAGWKRGYHIKCNGVFELPGEATNFGGFDYRGFLKKQGIHWQLAVAGTQSVDILSKQVPVRYKPQSVFDELRGAISSLMDRLYPSGDSGYMKGLVVGIRSDLDPDQFDDFSRLGLTHVLAISGLHVAVVVFIFLHLGALLKFTRERTLDLTMTLIPVYMMLTGASPSAVRACLMAMIALWLARKHALKDGLHLLSAAAMLMLMWNPMLIEDVSFQLSFIVTAGLLLFVPIISESLPIRWKWLRSAVAVTITAQIVSFPLTVYYFHTINLLSLPANFVLVPFISFIVMPLGMGSIAMGALWPPLGIIPAKLATIGNRWTFGLVDKLSEYKELRSVWAQTSLPWIIAAYLLMGLGVWLLKKRLEQRRDREWRGDGKANSNSLIRVYWIGWVVVLSTWFLWGRQPAFMNRAAYVSFIDVGQGDSILIRTGEGKHILIDTGGTVRFRKKGDEWRERRNPYEIGRKLLVPLLLKRGITELDALVLTHLDTDHIGGALAILNQIPVKNVWFNGTVKDSPSALNIFREALKQNISLYALESDMSLRLDNSMRVEVVYPEALTSSKGGHMRIPVLNEQNDRSIVLLLTVYGRRFLLPGDLEARGEDEILSASSDYNANSIDVLKIGHHGSKTSTSSEWLAFWHPKIAVISVGRNNTYGHPHPAVMERLDGLGTTVFRTDSDGEIQFRVDENGTLSRRTMLSRSLLD